jgi:divalent metal cation (Fe/Co/Zn/Cd) transporter
MKIIKIKVPVAVLFALVSFGFSNTASSQSLQTEIAPIKGTVPNKLYTSPPIVYVWQDKSNELPGTTSTKTVVVVGVSLVVVAAVIILLTHNKKHAKENNKNAIISNGSNSNFDVNIVFNNNLKQVGIRYAFK